jgi:hypothetical protein
VARGWESKSVEEQQAAAFVAVDAKSRLNREQIAIKQQREALSLSRKHVQQQLQAAQSPRHRQMLESALDELDARLARLV